MMSRQITCSQSSKATVVWSQFGHTELPVTQKKMQNVSVLYGHIHQEHHQITGHIAHHAAKSLMWALPAPGSVPKKVQIPWDATSPYKGLGFRTCLLYTSPSPRDRQKSRMPSSA